MSAPSVNGSAAAYLECAKWHEQQIATAKRLIEKAEEWSAANNDGHRNLGGLRYTDDLPREIKVHERSAKKFRRMARTARS